MAELELTYDEPGLSYDDPCYMYDGSGIYTDTVVYDQALLGYDDSAFTYDGDNLCPVIPIPPEPPQPEPITYPSIYWKGIGGGEARKKPKNFLSVAVTSKCLAVNGYEVGFSVCADELRFAGEEDETEVRARVQGASNTLPEPLFDLQVASSPLDEGTLEEEEEDILEGSYEALEDEEDFSVFGSFQDDSDLYIEAMVLTGSSHELTLSCLPITKSLDGENEGNIVIEVAVAKNERDEDPEDEG